ncbi:rho GTPase-activating protein 21-B-like isoform X1 [Tachypleus tridentatus]|uniref:rho GTPase-activating protein 21-B-like isoform X1 n=2 Tax=Tachypleus tridentatus TaxID=6853 RepID=UPI003FCF2913
MNYIDKHMFKGHSLMALEGERSDGSVPSIVHYPTLQQYCPCGCQDSEEVVDTLSEPSSHSLTPDVTRSQHVSSFQLIDQRCHQFKPSYLLARQLERINLHRSELAKMSPHHPIMTLRAAKFQGREIKSDSETVSPTSVNHRALPKPHHQMVGLKHHPATWKGFKEFSQKKLPSGLDTPVFIIKEKEQQLTVCNDITQMKDTMHKDDDRATSDQQFTTECSSRVVLRKKPPIGEVPLGHRVSCLKATPREHIDVDSDIYYSDEKEDHSIISDQLALSSTHQLQKLGPFHREKTSEKVKATETKPTEDESMEHQGWLACKALTVEGKRSSDRSWRPVWAVLNAEILYLLKEKRYPSEVGSGIQDTHIPVKSSIAGIARDYTKKKHVFRLCLPGGTEYLLQADTHVQMIEWLAALQHIKMEDHKGWLNKPTSVLEKATVFELQQVWNTTGCLSPLPRPIKKFALRHRSSSGIRAHKGGRAYHADEVPKSVSAWRGRVVHGLKMFNSTPAKGTSSGLRLEEYQSSQNNQFVPLIVDVCIGIVETRGLDTVGIYRIPGNNATVSLLINAVNQQTTTIDLQDAHWNDVNVVSSLLKAFFRKLSEPLFTSSLYSQFIAASKLENPASKLRTIHQLIHLLPPHNFETLKCIMNHLNKVSIHASNNKMEARNLAIVFGPTLVRSADNNMIALVTDMPHQCCVTETIIKNAEWLFTKSPTQNLANFPENYVKRSFEPLAVAEQVVLVQNIHKMDEGTGISGREFVSSLMSAAHQKVRHRQKKAAIHTNEQIISNEKKYSITGQRRKLVKCERLEPTTHKSVISQFMFVPQSHEKSLTLSEIPTSDSCSRFHFFAIIVYK